MTAHTRISSRGQVVIPKAIRDALHLKTGEALEVRLQGRRIVLETPEAPRERISYEEFRRRIPRHEGPALTIEEMNAAVDRMFAKRGRS
jgi:AbrB family looped-hinge helix DNA binding protein